MSTRAAAIAEWTLAAVILLWVITFQVLTSLDVEFTLGVSITSVPVAFGLILSLTVNGALHYMRRPLRPVEAVFLVIEAVLLVLFVVAGVFDQLELPHGQYPAFGSNFGHWLDWFMPLWLLIGPVALTILILAIVSRSRAKPV